MSRGVKIRGVEKFDKDAPEDKMIEFQVWPLPESVIVELFERLKKVTTEFLVEKKLSNGKETDLTAKGPVQ